MLLPFRHHPIYGLPFEATVANELEREYRLLPRGRRASALRKVMQREVLLRLTGQSRLRLDRAPANARRMLWIYTWTTIGDSVMDLAVRMHLPPQLRLDLLVAPFLAPLYAADPRLDHVFTDAGECRGPYDFVLLQDLSTASIALKRRIAPRAPFATVFENLRGECFDRPGFSQRRMEQLFDIPVASPARPTLHLGGLDACRPLERERTCIAVALGARDSRRRYPHWPQVLRTLVTRWPTRLPPPLFVLIGNANARDQLGEFAAPFVARHCRIEVETLDLCATAALLGHCDAFVGADGGLMHLAVALEKPGLALFVGIDPRWRLPAQTLVASLFTPSDIAGFPPDEIAAALLAAL